MFVVDWRNTEAGIRMRAAARQPLHLPLPEPQEELVEEEESIEVPAKSNVEVIKTPRAELYRVIGLVARMHGSTFADVMGGSQTPVVAAARWAAMCAVYENCRVESAPPTTCSVGRLFGRNHSSVRNALIMRGLKPGRSLGSRT